MSGFHAQSYVISGKGMENIRVEGERLSKSSVLNYIKERRSKRLFFKNY